MAQFNGTEGTDFFFGTEEDDMIFGNGGDDDLHGAGGNDFVDGGEGSDILSGGEGHDFVFGGAGNDNVGWTAGDDTVLGGDGDDFVHVSAQAASEDVFASGGSGTDWLEYSGDAVIIDLGKGMLHTTFQGEDVSVRLEGLEHVMAVIDEPVHVTGDAGANVLFTGNADDTLIGGGGRDTLLGAPGDDLYVLNSRPGEADAPHLIFDKFNLEEHGFVENDRIALDRHVMKELGAKGDFGADDERFHAAAGATGGAEADDRVIYDTDAGRLYYDADGSGSGEALLIATLSTFGADLAAGDITVI